MAGINSLLKGAAESFAKDTAGKILTPSQMEFAKFLLNPQFYLAEQGINKLASLMGYGQENKQLQADAKDEQEYFKEVMRDSIGNALPNEIGDFVRATPRISEADSQPAGTYTAFDPETQTYIQQASSNPISRVDSATFENAVRDDTYGTLTPGLGKYVGPLPEDNPMFQNRVENLAYDLKSMPTEGVPEGLDIERLRNFLYGNPEGDYGPTSEMVIVDNKEPNVATEAPIDFGGTMDYSDMFDFSGMDFSGMDFGGGGGGDRGDFDYSAYEMAKGVQILRGRR
jgi:hypothetical protein